jgi:hypothetical protein
VSTPVMSEVCLPGHKAPSTIFQQLLDVTFITMSEVCLPGQKTGCKIPKREQADTSCIGSFRNNLHTVSEREERLEHRHSLDRGGISENQNGPELLEV